MNQLILIGLGGALGAIMRHLLANGIYQIMGRGFPWGTLSVNILGSLMIGFFYVLFAERSIAALETRSFVLIGLLGGFTTFSTFSMETVNLIESGDIIHAGMNILSSVIFCIIACWIGVLIARQI